MPGTRRALLGALTLILSVVAASASAYTPPRLDDGRPDLQGNWVAYNRTPLARPDSLTELYITVESRRRFPGVLADDHRRTLYPHVARRAELQFTITGRVRDGTLR